MSEKELFSLDIEKIQQKIQENDISICVIGIGRIGLPTALSFAKSGLKTVGLDINEILVNRINSGDFPLKDEPAFEEIFNQVLKIGTFSAITEIKQVVPKSDVILLSLPTTMDENNVPVYSALETIGAQLSELMSLGTILIVESTIEPGFIENEFLNIVEGKSGRLKAGNNFGLGVCPENANPGEIKKDFESLPRLVGAIDEKTTQIIMKIYQHVFPVELIRMPNCKTANAVKLTTNIFRDINIAFVNELALLFEKMGIDVLTVLEAADKKYNFQKHYPGAGVGGPCLPINSYQILNSAKKIGSFSKIVQAAREINESMPLHIVDLIVDGFSEANLPVKGSTILVLGVSYKPEVKDVQLTPAKKIIEKLHELGANVKIYDPYFKNSELFDLKTENNLEEAVSNTNAVVIVTAHTEFQNIEPIFFKEKMKSPIVIDSRGVIDNDAAKKAELIFRGLGRGKI